jgi:hypothetical protein
LAKSRGKDDEPESDRAARKPAATTSMIQSGSFAVVNGSIVTAGAVEPQKQRAKGSASTGQTLSGDTIRRVRSHHFSLFAVPDQVIPDDLIVQGSGCFGLDCVNNENFGFDTIRTKENNTRIQFDDTSTSAGFEPTVQPVVAPAFWRLSIKARPAIQRPERLISKSMRALRQIRSR